MHPAVFLGLGSNLGDREAAIDGALARLAAQQDLRLANSLGDQRPAYIGGGAGLLKIRQAADAVRNINIKRAEHDPGFDHGPGGDCTKKVFLRVHGFSLSVWRN